MATRRGRPPKSEAKDTRSAILDAALDLYAAKGYEATSVRDIGRQVGVRDSALYGHFVSKAEILQTLLGMYGPNAMTMNVQKLALSAAVADPKRSLQLLSREVISAWLDEREQKFFRIMLMENLKADCDPEIRITNLIERQRKRLLPIMEGLAVRLVTNQDPSMLLNHFFMPLIFLRLEKIAFATPPASRDALFQLADQHVDDFFRGLGA